MRVTPLHNFRQPGTVPNGFQKEEAPSPTPDRNSQPEMRNHTQHMTDTRHAVEYFNPLSRMETNSANRTNNSFPPSREMGVEEEQLQGQGKEKEIAADEDTVFYERLLRLFAENQQLSSLSEGREPVIHEQDENLLREEEQDMSGYAMDERQIEYPGRHVEELQTALSLEEESGASSTFNYELQRGIDIYRQMQNFFEMGRYQYEA